MKHFFLDTLKGVLDSRFLGGPCLFLMFLYDEFGMVEAILKNKVPPLAETFGDSTVSRSFELGGKSVAGHDDGEDDDLQAVKNDQYQQLDELQHYQKNESEHDVVEQGKNYEDDRRDFSQILEIRNLPIEGSPSGILNRRLNFPTEFYAKTVEQTPMKSLLRVRAAIPLEQRTGRFLHFGLSNCDASQDPLHPFFYNNMA